MKSNGTISVSGITFLRLFCYSIIVLKFYFFIFILNIWASRSSCTEVESSKLIFICISILMASDFWPSLQARALRAPVFLSEVGRSATCSAMRNSATCATRKFAADVRFNPQAADCGIAPAH
jgi:hypothetical protein